MDFLLRKEVSLAVWAKHSCVGYKSSLNVKGVKGVCKRNVKGVRI